MSSQHRGASQRSPRAPRAPRGPRGLTDPGGGFTPAARPGSVSGASRPNPPEYLHCNRCYFMRFLSLKCVVMTERQRRQVGL